MGEAGGARADPGAYRDLRADEPALRGLLAEERSARARPRPTLDAMYERMGFVRLLEAYRRTELGHLALRQLARLPGRDPFDVEARVARASQALDRMTHGLAHPLHLAVASLVQRELEPCPVSLRPRMRTCGDVVPSSESTPSGSLARASAEGEPTTSTS